MAFTIPQKYQDHVIFFSLSILLFLVQYIWKSVFTMDTIRILPCCGAPVATDVGKTFSLADNETKYENGTSHKQTVKKAKTWNMKALINTFISIFLHKFYLCQIQYMYQCFLLTFITITLI